MTVLYETTLSLIIQPRTASRPYCRRLNACKSGERDDLVSPLNGVSATSKQLAINAFCTGESAVMFLNSPQSRSQSFVPLDQRSENESSGSNHFRLRHRCRCAVSRITRIRLFPLFFHNGCSQSSRFPTAGQGERSSGNEIEQPAKARRKRA